MRQIAARQFVAALSEGQGASMGDSKSRFENQRNYGVIKHSARHQMHSMHHSKVRQFAAFS
ncbi:hypothetical protein [Nitrosomonas communis]|uniref:hypothetical protein n=1 Tax=Nitrosomonas communis TaxID=44574 RepID=UPI0026EF8D44|nr:hypothetical protein [Nitrosomonas communis]MCO6427656.1 hypothetical protein [Nitrosomonas communis]